MKILLINANPVVSRLLVLCTRDESIVLDEAVSADMVKSDDYDIVLVDEASHGADVSELLTLFGTSKKVFISYDNEPMNGFDVTLKKPFLPSQILELIENPEPQVEVQEEEVEENEVQKEEMQKEEMIEEEVETAEEDHFIFPLATEESSKEKIEVEEMPSIFPLADTDDMIEEIQEDEVLEEVEEDEDPAVLDGNEIEKIKALLDMDEEEADVISEVLTDDEYEVRKMEAIKEQLIADGLEIVGETEIVEELSANSEKKIAKKKNKKNKEKQKVKNKKSDSKKSDSTKTDNKKSKKKSNKKEVAFTEEELESIEDAIEVAVATVTKKQMKQLLKGKKIEVSIEIEGDK